MKVKLIKYDGDYPKDITIGNIYNVISEGEKTFVVIDDDGDARQISKEYCEIVNEPTKQVSDGGSTSYYKFPEGATELFDLINHRNMNFAVGNIFKACYRMGEKEGIDDIYDLKKIIFMAEQELKRLGHKPD